MNFPTTGPTNGLPAWPQASAPAPALPVTAGDGFALAIDGAMALLAAADGTTMLGADAKPALGHIAPSASTVAAPIPVATATPKVTVRIEDPVLEPSSRPASAPPTNAALAPLRPILRAVALVAPPLPSAVADPIRPPRTDAAALPIPVKTIPDQAIPGKAQRDPVPLAGTNMTAPPPPPEPQEGFAHPPALDTAINEVPKRAPSTQELPVPTPAAVIPVAAAPEASLANPDAPPEPRSHGATIAAPSKQPIPIQDPATNAEPMAPAPVVAPPFAAIPRGTASRAAPDRSVPDLTILVGPVAPTAENAVAAVTLSGPQAPVPVPDAPPPAVFPTKIRVPNIPPAAPVPFGEVVTPPATPSARRKTPAAVPSVAAEGAHTESGRPSPVAVAGGGPAAPSLPDVTTTRSLAPSDEATSTPIPMPVAIEAVEPAPVRAAVTPSSSDAASATPRTAPASPAAEPIAPTAPPAPVTRPVAAERRLPGTLDTATPTASVLTVTVAPTTAAMIEPVAANAEPLAAYAALPGVLAAQTVPLMRPASPATAAPVPVPMPDAKPTAPAPAPLAAPIPAAPPVSAIGGATLVRQPTPAAPTLEAAPADANAQPAAPVVAVAGAAQPAPKAPRAKPSVTLRTMPDVPPDTIVSAPEANSTLPSRPASLKPAVADSPRLPAPDAPERADHPAAAAVDAPLLPQIVAGSIPIPAAAAPAADTAKPNSVRRASPALGAIAPGSPPVAARDTAVSARDTTQSTAAPDAPKFADALPAPAAPADAKPAVAPLLTAEPLRGASPQPLARAADAAPTPVITAQPGHIGRDLGVEIARRVSAGGNELVVRLAPAELGRIEVRMSFDDRGGLTTVIAADSPLALDMLRRDSADLSRSLSDAGFRSDGQSLRFDGGDRSGGQPRSPWQNANPKPGQSADFGPASDFETSPYRPLRTSGRYDLMA